MFSRSFDTDSDNECKVLVATQRGRKNIKNIKELEDLNTDTKIANTNEKERIKRIQSKEQKFQSLLNSQEFKNQLLLDFDFENNVPIVSVHNNLVVKLKFHQKEGVKFMWNACYESLEEIEKSDGSGCILAHCMGLGKTFQVITLVHTLLSHPQIGTRTVLICCPKNTLLNWINEFGMWITPELGQINIYNPTRFKNTTERLNELSSWKLNGGVCTINYELLRLLLEVDERSGTQLSLSESKKCHEYLCNPGPDLVICDEGHVLKNEETKLTKIMSGIRTLRRIVLTGTPMQNNLIEYYCMIQFVKPNLLGTRKEFTNMFVNPILNGQYENSFVEDVQVMKERSHILHKKLSGCVQRFDLTTLKAFLPEKREYVISVALTESQVTMYRYYLGNYSSKGDWKNGTALFFDYQALQRIWTHPYNLKIHGDKFNEDKGGNERRKTRKKKRREEESENEESNYSMKNYASKCPPLWWLQFVSFDDFEDATKSGKLVILLKILQECEDANEKILVFSGSLYSLAMIQYFLSRINCSEFEDPCLCNMTSTWEEELDYLVLTGQTSSEDRDRYCQIFNNIHDPRLRLFLISTKAGGMGINLTAANRAVLFDVSWNPSHDIQSIFRIYRIGQTKPCFVYRFVASGTMEEKIYERQVAKQSISFRVVDEKQIARHYTQSELLQLYQFEPNKEHKAKGAAVLQDPLLQKILTDEMKFINGVHEHDSLLEHREEEELREREKNDAWIAHNDADDIRSLPKYQKVMLAGLTPESFDPAYLRMVLKKKYKKRTDGEIAVMMENLLPKIEDILRSPDFINIMKREALLYHKRRQSRHKRPATFRRNRNKAEETIVLDDSVENFDLPSRSPPAHTSMSAAGGDRNLSDSDDSVFLFEVGRNPRRKKRRSITPLKSWGRRNGKKFASPARD